MRGKTRPRLRWSAKARTASMRPPQNAGENPEAVCLAEVDRLASMRPPQNAGENITPQPRT